MSTSRPERVFAGQVASPGLVAGHIRLAGRRTAASAKAADPREERRRFEAALALAAEELGRLLEREGEAAASGILEFQIALIEDAELIEPEDGRAMARRILAGLAVPGPRAAP